MKTLGTEIRKPAGLGVGRRVGGEKPEAFTEVDTVVPKWKRILDLAIIGLTAPAWGLLMLVLAAGIKLVSRGPVLFRQERIGFGERKFVCLKFRTMRMNAETTTHQAHLSTLVDSDAPMKKMDHLDPRLIPGAWIMRSTGLDELPQLFNVIRGDMSLVGPRPCTEYEFAKYKAWQRERFCALPGLTGLWQVNGKNRTTFSRMVELDIHYARTSCLWLDLGIMFRTFPALLGQFIDNRLERAFLPSVSERPVANQSDLLNRSLKVNGVAR